jgi:hypothetical protein
MRTLKLIFMKRIFTLFLLLMGLQGWAQQYNNEWIRYNQTYYKFKLRNTGLYRIPRSVLDAAGIGNTPVQFLELWRNGQPVPIYPTVSSGALPSNGYIEFWGEANDGKADKALYREPQFQHVDKFSLQTDTAAYFLSVNTDQSGALVQDVSNDVSLNTLPAEPYFIHTAGAYFANQINHGFAAVVGEYVYSSSYDKGEFFSTSPIGPGVFNHGVLTPAVYSAGPAARLNFGAVGQALNARTIKANLNGTDIKESTMDYFNDVNTSANFPNSLLSSGTANLAFYNTSAVSTDRMVMSYYEVIYPRQFDFSNQTNFEFRLPAKAAGYYLEISNFNNGGTAPVLYDLTTRKRYVGDINVAGKVRFLLPPSSTECRFMLVSYAASIAAVNSLTPKNFIDFSSPANQADYLIVSSSFLYTGTHGNNPVEDYRAYRASVAGGSHNAKIFDIDELVDQFAFGIKKHPLSIRNFLRYARARFSAMPTNVLLIGHGMTYTDYRSHESNFVSELLNMVPTWGTPASDNMLAADNNTSAYGVTPIGRLSVINAKELEDYLEKMKEFELTQKTAANTVEDRGWMKNIVHVTGASDLYLGTVLCNYMNGYKTVIEDTVFGGTVYTFCKNTTNAVEQLGAAKLNALFQEGINILTYFGHSSSTTLEFNLSDPYSYNNPGKYPIFYVNGCNAGNFYTYYPARVTNNETISEKFNLAKQRGTIAFVASTHFGIVNYLNLFLSNLYDGFSHGDYGKTIGEANRDAFKAMIAVTGPHDFYARLHAEEMTLHGDPAIKISVQPKPDYVVESSLVTLNPSFISVAETSFKVKVKLMNLGKSLTDSITVQIKRQLPDGTTTTVYRQRVKSIVYADSISLEIPIDGFKDKGQNKLIVSVDDDNEVNEMEENNNIVSKDFFIYEDEARATYPYQFAIVSDPAQKLIATTANPFSLARAYRMELDTTELFNSSLKVSKIVSSAGGVIEFDPGIVYMDSTVYYWRISAESTDPSKYIWNNSSFVFIPGDVDGFNQSHYFQHAKSKGERMSIDSASRKFMFGKRTNDLFITQGLYPTSGVNDADFAIQVNGATIAASACIGYSLIFNVFDPLTFKPWSNVGPGRTSLRLSGSAASCAESRDNNFEFSFQSSASRKLMMNFMDSIPDGFYVTVRSIDYSSAGTAAVWQADTALFGTNNSLYHRLLAAGLTNIDSLYTTRCWALVYKKNDFDFAPVARISRDMNDRILMPLEIYTGDTLGYFSSPVLGPAKAWKELIWRGAAEETPTDDNVSIQVIGLDSTGRNPASIYTIDKNTQNFDLSAIDPLQYPFLQLKMKNMDSTRQTPYQLKYWRVMYTPAPEGSLAGNIFYVGKDTLDIGERVDFGIAFKNISKYKFDSLSLKITILDKNNVTRTLDYKKQKPLISGDTIKIQFSLDSREYPGLNTLFVEVNPNNEQPEQVHFNNFLFKNFYVRTDAFNPLLDVTFDGAHILNRDLVSAKPHIQIKLKDEAKFMLLNDTSLVSVQIRYPNGMLRSFKYDNDTLRFIPAVNGTDNTATIDFMPQFLSQINPEGDDYELIVKGKDKSGNTAGSAEYRVTFKIITKPMISNLLNYPNPFSTSTAFVFTVTGSEIPQNMKIQILTVTGKIVREITKEELGPIRIGRNITEYKWNGTDQYGQKLGNGVYLYRVVTTLNGKQMDKYRAEGDNTDRYFNNGYGKMYLMR